MRRDQSVAARILMAGNASLCAQLRRALEAAPFEIRKEHISAHQDLVKMLDRTRPDILVLDATHPELDALAALAALGKCKSPPRVVLIAPEYRPLLAIAQDYPACYGTLLQRLALSPLLRPVLEGIAAGSTYYTPPPQPSNLTRYQFTLLCLMALGLDNHELAQALERSPHSVYSAQDQVRRKLGVATNQQAIVKAIELGLVAVLKKPVHPHPALRRK